MAETRPRAEQLRFLSSKTGNHIIDTYLEACEFGTAGSYKTLPALLNELFTEAGEIDPTSIQFRVNGSDGQLQNRFGHYTDPEAGWVNINQKIFQHRGVWQSSTPYVRLDVVEDDKKVWVALENHTSGSTQSADYTKWGILLDGRTIFEELEQFNDESAPRLDLLEEYVLLDIDIL